MKERVLFDIPVQYYDPDFVEHMEINEIENFLKMDEKYAILQINKARERFSKHCERVERFGPRIIIVSPDI